MQNQPSNCTRLHLDISIELENELIEIIDKLAEKQNMTRDKFINQCIAVAMEHIDDSY